ncbi:hypothetical protein OUZ56_009660 [Daphnia magna]|uniref:Uncharacterized protein n=1 Tax=Daphnia magna TaxID=35525 RepID=A0ABR0AGN8_9CRUS|nr:hypothetical protein OUZ56_009660 [Daphnia magna]
MGKRELKDFVADNDEENEQHSVQQSNACDVNALENVDLRIVENVANDPEHFVDHHVMEEIQSELGDDLSEKSAGNNSEGVFQIEQLKQMCQGLESTNC